MSNSFSKSKVQPKVLVSVIDDRPHTDSVSFLSCGYRTATLNDGGFDFLGYHFHPAKGMTKAEKTLMRFVERANRLYEQERGKPQGFPRFGLYVIRWVRWVRIGLPQGTTVMRHAKSRPIPVAVRSQEALPHNLR